MGALQSPFGTVGRTMSKGVLFHGTAPVPTALYMPMICGGSDPPVRTPWPYTDHVREVS
jgi:hypothetical protein